MEKITIIQFLSFTNVYVHVYIEDEFQRYDGVDSSVSDLTAMLNREQLNCPIDYIRNVDGGHRNDDEKDPHGIVLGIGIENFEKYFVN